MAGHSTYPEAADLEALLGSAGITLDPDQVASAVLAGIEAFEGAVDRHMLAGKDVDNSTIAAQTRAYSPPQNTLGLLDLEGDLPAAPTVVYRPAGGGGESLALTTDYLLDPQNAPLVRRPYERIQFRRRWYQPYGWDFTAAVEVTGLWGYGTTIPEDAWRAMLHTGMIQLLGHYFAGQTGALVEWKEEDVSEKYAIPPLMDRMAALKVDVGNAVAKYRKVSLG